MSKIMFDFSKSNMGANKFARQEPKRTLSEAGAAFRAGTPPAKVNPPGLTFPSLNRIMAEKAVAEQNRIADILHPDTSRRLRFASHGDPPPPEPKREDFKPNDKLSFPSMQATADREAEERFQAAHTAWTKQLHDEKIVMDRALGINK